MKIVINICHGGFGLSKKAVMRYAELAGIKLYHFRAGGSFLDHYYRVPVEEFNKIYNVAKESKDFTDVNEKYFTYHTIPRNDPYLIQTVEELGKDSWGIGAELKVVLVPDDVKWEIFEYDGMEHVAEVHRIWN
jgi:hypothetical protein